MTPRCGLTPMCLLAFSLVLWVAPAAANCKLSRLLELPVTMVDMHPMVTAKINGRDAEFIVDSGAFYSMMTPGGAADLNLKPYPAPWGFEVKGLGGEAGGLSIATVKDFALQGLTAHNVEFLVGGSDVGGAGVIGQNVLRIADVEYDLARGVIRLIREENCSHANNLAYWIAGTDQVYSLIDIANTTPLMPHTSAVAFVNDVKVRVMFDTGAFASILTKKAAERAGIDFDGPGVVKEGGLRGLGKDNVSTWIAKIDSFKLGDEAIRNTKLRIADTEISGDTEMLLGADFFLAHHVYVSSKQRRLFFTYNGGAVFNLRSPANAAQLTATPPPAPAEKAPSAPTEPPGDPDELARRGAASAARRDFLPALADLDRACTLAPNNADYRYQRGLVHLALKQRDLASGDFDATLSMDPDHVPARLARASLRLANGDAAAAVTDLDAATRVADKSADVRLLMALRYTEADRLDPALNELDLWIASHRDDSRLGEALWHRCRLRALTNQQLKGALDDCSLALERVDKSSERTPEILDGRGLANLRLGDYAKAIKDFDAALVLRPNDAWAHYARGIARLRTGSTADGEADVAAAKAESAGAVKLFENHGIIP